MSMDNNTNFYKFYSYMAVMFPMPLFVFIRKHITGKREQYLHASPTSVREIFTTEAYNVK